MCLVFESVPCTVHRVQVVPFLSLLNCPLWLCLVANFLLTNFQFQVIRTFDLYLISQRGKRGELAELDVLLTCECKPMASNIELCHRLANKMSAHSLKTCAKGLSDSNSDSDSECESEFEYESESKWQARPGQSSRLSHVNNLAMWIFNYKLPTPCSAFVSIQLAASLLTPPLPIHIWISLRMQIQIQFGGCV